MSLSDRKLVRNLRRRDEDAFRELVRVYQHRVFNIVYRILGDREEAEDVAQEVFVAIFKHIDSFRGDAKFSTWVYRIATNQARNRLKYHARRHRRDHQNYEDAPESAHQDSDFAGTIPQPEDAVLGRELEKIIQEGLAELGEIHRTIIVLRDVEHLSYQEIAEIVELPEGTVKSRLFRARVALKEYVEKRYDS
ncbi:sigma-70 family RNA polymerase sigma factor [Microvenator marinus]|jgi:RNA polymerase sigma-70 factor (ECF subfamily)|uniref:Sigma-70 family RNA polymerase sigma factor n=1 Tax=Microvenator marinus TaxID=2600177 RepID=A0A5B8XTY0_9DELT|nr:sigma-70 family RNA polymerase sigma factor [Microvenator marinus]QED28587.1 sigma-70 family RNA polymerase sigma factor [Microvenator marinus]